MLRHRLTPAVLTLFAAFGIVATLMVFGVTSSADDALLRAAGASRTDQRTAVMQFLTFLGNGRFEIPLAFGLIGVLFAVHQRYRARSYFLACISGEALYALAKLGFHRPRPEIIAHLSDAGWSSFPSGHAMLAPVIYTLGFVLVARSIGSRPIRAVLSGLGLLLPLLIAISRVYLGVHYPSDVVAGLFLGSAWALLWLGDGSRESASATSSAPATR